MSALDQDDANGDVDDDEKFEKNFYEKHYASRMVVRSEMTFHELCDATGYGANALDDDK